MKANYININNKADFKKSKDYTVTKTLVFLEQHKELLALMLEELFFHNELIYWKLFSENGKLDIYKKAADNLAGTMDNILNSSYDFLFENLDRSLNKFYDEIVPEIDKDNPIHKAESATKIFNF